MSDSCSTRYPAVPHIADTSDRSCVMDASLYVDQVYEATSSSSPLLTCHILKIPLLYASFLDYTSLQQQMR